MTTEATHTTPPRSLKASPRRPTMPRSLDAGARRVWRATVKELDALGILARADREVLAAFCRGASLAERAWEELADEQLTVEGAQGGRRANPTILVWRQATAIVDNLAKQLGCSPVARLRMPEPPDDGDDSDLD